MPSRGSQTALKAPKMSSFALLALLACISTVSSLNCYYTASVDKSYKPLLDNNIECNANVTMCYKRTVSKASGSLVTGVYYGCDTSNLCSGIKDGKCKNSNNINTCCCGGNACNPSASLSFFTAVTILPIVKILI